MGASAGGRRSLPDAPPIGRLPGSRHLDPRPAPRAAPDATERAPIAIAGWRTVSATATRSLFISPFFVGGRGGGLRVWGGPPIRSLGLHALQHRGQESAGIVDRRRGAARPPRDGLVADVFTADARAPAGRRAIGHVRYSTAGGSHAEERAAARRRLPRAAPSRSPTTATSSTRRRSARARGRRLDLPASTDTEVIVHLIARAARRRPSIEKSVEALGRSRARTRCSSSPKTPDRRARSDGLPPARARPAQGTRSRCSRARPPRSTSSRRSTSARSSRARWSSSTSTASLSPLPGAARRRRPLHLRARLLRAAGLGARSASRSTRCASAFGRRSRRSTPSRRTSSSRCRTPASRGDRLRRGERHPVRRWASSAPTTSAARSSSRSSRSATSA